MSNSKLSNAGLTSTRKRVTNILDNAPQVYDGVSLNMDPAIHGNDKALQKLCDMDLNGLPSIANFLTFQVYICQYQRNAEVQWILEMCEKFHCDSLVFPLATSYFDRYLCARTAEYQELRFISSACIFLAAKMKMAKPPKYDAVQADFPHLTTKKLFDYELKVSQAIKWNFAMPTPFEFFDHFLAFSPYFMMLREGFERAIRAIYCDFDLACFDPKIQALGALYFAITIDTDFTNCLPTWFSYFQRFPYSLHTLKHIYDQLYMKQGLQGVGFFEYNNNPQTYISTYADYNLFGSEIWSGPLWDNVAKVPHVLF
uniref:Cyclin-like domain-containing protein n=1 Tax=Panagrolaimus sp. PS1159 TaxID=55785 RepID=A0AC35GD71_9BILA